MPFLEIKSLSKSFRQPANLHSKHNKQKMAVDNISLTIHENSIVGLIGESGSGKTTLAKCILHLSEPDSGSIIFKNLDITKVDKKTLIGLRRQMQMIHQNAGMALNPMHTVGMTLTEPLKYVMLFDKEKVSERINELLEAVGLSEKFLAHYPAQLSGGQKQRVAIARALAVEPAFLIADEPTSSLDTTYKNQVLNLLSTIREKYGLTLLIISHDIKTITMFADEIAVMYKGQIVEQAAKNTIHSNPLHPYTKDLFNSSALNINEELRSSSLINKSTQYCNYAHLCHHAEEICYAKIPQLKDYGIKHNVSCHRVHDFIKNQRSLKRSVTTVHLS